MNIWHSSCTGCGTLRTAALPPEVWDLSADSSWLGHCARCGGLAEFESVLVVQDAATELAFNAALDLALAGEHQEMLEQALLEVLTGLEDATEENGT